MMADLSELQKAVDAALADLHEKQLKLVEAEIEELEPRHILLRQKCRQAMDEHERLYGSQPGQHSTEGLPGDINSAAVTLLNAQNAVESAQESLRFVQRLPPYPTEQEIAAAQHQRKELDDFLIQSRLRVNAAQQEFDRLRSEGNAAAQQFSALQHEEHTVSEKLSRLRSELYRLKPSMRPPAVDLSTMDNLTYVFNSSPSEALELTGRFSI